MERLDHTVVYYGKLVNLAVDRVRMESGRETTREVIEHPGSVVMLPVTNDGMIWFVRQHRYAVGEDLLELPAGIIDPGETPRETAERELREEVGLSAGEFAEIATLYPSAGFSNERVFVFLARDCVPVERPERDEGLTIEPQTIDVVREMAARQPVPFHNAATAFAVLWYLSQ